MSSLFWSKKILVVYLIVVIACFFPAQYAHATEETFTSSTSWTAPPGVTSVSVQVWGAGGGGGRGPDGIPPDDEGGGGGGGGAYSIKTVTVVPGNNYTVTVGSGGGEETAGGDSWFVDTFTVLAKGGSGAMDDIGGAGGNATLGVGDTKYSGGTGGTAVGGLSGGGGGGSSAGTSSNGNNGSGNVDGIGGARGTAPTGGAAGGAGSSVGGGSGVNGSNYGGGGGGRAYGTVNPGSGAGGKIVLTYAADTIAPTITNVSSDKANGTYTVGEVIDIDVTFSEAVTSTGNVTVTLETGDTDRTCTFTVSNASTGTCNYTVQSGDTSSDLTVSTISGTINDAASNAMTNFVPATNLAANKALVIDTTGGDTTAPILLTFRSTTADGTYGPNSKIVIIATYDENLGSESTITVTLNNSKKILLNTISGATVQGTYVVGSTGSSESTNDLTIASIYSESVQDASGNTRTNSGVPENTHNLGDESDIGIDTTAPIVTVLNPADNAANVRGNSNFVMTFNEPVTAHSGTIYIRRYNTNAIVATIGVLTSQVTGVGTNTITINPIKNLAVGNGYYIQIPATAFKDGADNFYEGFTAKVVWNFTTTGYVTHVALSPTDNTTDVDVSSNFVMTFNKPVFVSPSNIRIRRSSNNKVVAIIPTTSSQVTGSGTNTITINPTNNLVKNTGYYIQIPGNAFRDSKRNFYAGFTNKTAWNFTTNFGPQLQLLVPADNANDVNVDANLILTFNKPVFVSSANILIKRTGDNTTVASINATSSQVTGNGTNTITINPSIYLPEKSDLYIRVPATAFKDSEGKFYTGITNKTVWNFTTACPLTNPLCVISTPAPTPIPRLETTPSADSIPTATSDIPSLETTPSADSIPTATSPGNPDDTLIVKIAAFVKELITSPRAAVPRIRKVLQPITDSSVAKIATIVGTVTAVASVAASAGSLASGAPSAVSQLPQSLQRIWQAILSLLGFRWKKRPWGRVIDADSGKPIAGVYIQVYDHQAKQLKNTVISNDRGAFSSMVPPGMYEFRAQKPGWVLTPKAPYLHLLAGEHVFDGSPVTVTTSQLLPLVLALRMSEEVPLMSHMVWGKTAQVIELFIARISWPLLLFGAILNTAALFVAPTILNIAVEGLYVVLIGLKVWIYVVLKPSVGYVRDSKTKEPLDLAFVRLYNAENNRLLETRTTGIDGKFLLLPSPGVYTILVVRAGYQSYKESHVVVGKKSEALALSFALEPTESAPSSPPVS